MEPRPLHCRTGSLSAIGQGCSAGLHRPLHDSAIPIGQVGPAGMQQQRTTTLHHVRAPRGGTTPPQLSRLTLYSTLTLSCTGCIRIIMRLYRDTPDFRVRRSQGPSDHVPGCGLPYNSPYTNLSSSASSVPINTVVFRNRLHDSISSVGTWRQINFEQRNFAEGRFWCVLNLLLFLSLCDKHLAKCLNG